MVAPENRGFGPLYVRPSIQCHTFLIPHQFHALYQRVSLTHNQNPSVMGQRPYFRYLNIFHLTLFLSLDLKAQKLDLNPISPLINIKHYHNSTRNIDPILLQHSMLTL